MLLLRGNMGSTTSTKPLTQIERKMVGKTLVSSVVTFGGSKGMRLGRSTLQMSRPKSSFKRMQRKSPSAQISRKWRTGSFLQSLEQSLQAGRWVLHFYMFALIFGAGKCLKE